MVTVDAPTLALTIGDPAGIGPEVVVRALMDPAIAGLARFLIVGDTAVVAEAERLCGARLAAAAPQARVHDPGGPGDPIPAYGQLAAASGRAALTYVREATDLCLAGRADAMVTAPINKA